MTPLRIAFLTPEFVTEPVAGGGLASYLERMTRVLRQQGHLPEVFVISRAPAGTIDYEGVPVHRVQPAHADLRLRAARALCRIPGMRALLPAVLALGSPLALARALARRERERPFELVQSADYQACGLFVPRRQRRPHLVRCSWAADAFREVDGISTDPEERWRAWLERLAIRRADRAYAPSRLVAEHYRRRYDLELRVVRPPLVRDAEPADTVPDALPQRFFIHFGRLMPRKGTDWLAEALPQVWQHAPDFRMVWAGECSARHSFEEWASRWGAWSSRVTWLGALGKPELYAVLQRAEASVLPSRVDNLPNTVIESLMFGVPVIGSRGASIDELVDEGVTGRLVAIGDAAALADAMLRMWNGRDPVRPGFHWRSPVREEMEPARAVANLLALAGIDGSQTRDAAGVGSLVGTP